MGSSISRRSSSNENSQAQALSRNRHTIHIQQFNHRNFESDNQQQTNFAVPPRQFYPQEYPRVSVNGGGGGGGNAPLPIPSSVPRVRPQQNSGNTNKSGQELQQTKTIKNQVNLKKQTLKVQKHSTDPNKIIPTFKFDASSPCSVTVFFMVKEDVTKKSQLITTKQEPGPRVFYDKGLGQLFPPPNKEGQYSLDLNLYKRADILKFGTEGDEIYPLVVRLETVTEKAMKEGHDLKELAPGSPIPAWVQSQSTYAVFRYDDCEWDIRAIKQKICVDSITYELQEIYGIQGMYNDKKTEKKEENDLNLVNDFEGTECVICLAAVKDTTVLPCRHMCMCQNCARELQRQQFSRCPICRDVIESLLHIRRQEKKTIENTENIKEDVEEVVTL